MKIAVHTLIVSSLFAVAFAATAFAADNDPVTIAGILDASGTPLTDEQATRIDEFEPPQRMRDGGMRAPGGGAPDRQARGGGMNSLFTMFTEQQTAALIATLGEAPSRGNTSTLRPNNLMQVITLEKAGVPFTEKQVNSLKNITMSRESMQQMMEIYTEEQREALGMMGGGMGGPGRMRGPGAPGGGMR